MQRREFVSAAASAPALLAQTAPSDRIRLGIIGFGGRGSYLFREIQAAKEPGVEIVAVCDVLRQAREDATRRITQVYGKAPFTCTRYEELLARKDVDAVIISAPDFTHSIMLRAAMEAAKDAYCEKPMGVKLQDARAAYLAVKRSKQVVQIGTQRRSEAKMITCAEMIRSGAIGQLTRADLQVHFQEPRWRRDHHMIQPADIDWSAFTMGQFTMGEFTKVPDVRLFREWQLFPETSNGIPGLWMSHFIDLAAWFLDDPYPTSAVAHGGVFLWKDGRATQDVFQTLVAYKECMISFAMSLTNASGARNEWYGTRGVLDADLMKLIPKGSRRPDRLEKEVAIEAKPGIESHMANWLRCIKSRQTPRADIQAGFSHAVAGCMSAEAYRSGRRVGFNREKLEFT
ncbi:MAG: Gfo/Idh/MocA family oxidoreductase [Acidobacteria bacterium]|nr:Gfo/Idh/MocA family oxidoreductase [Acidobacteriota bacterium]